jgi:hypothetical protein
MILKFRRIRTVPLLLAAALIASIPLANTASAATATVTGNISGDPVAPGQEQTLSFSISPSSRTLQSFVLTPPANWQLAGTPTPGAPNFAVEGNTLVASNLSVSSSGSATVQFNVKTGCKSGPWDWQLAAKDSQGRLYGNDGSDLTTQVTSDCSLAFANQPEDALKTKLITGTDFVDTTDFVTVELLNGAAQRVDYFPVAVGFDLAAGTGLASGALTAPAQTTVDGVATFGAGTLSIATPNEPQFTDYKLKAKTVGTYAGLPGATSVGFDIWEAACVVQGCSVTNHGNRDTYTGVDSLLTASTLATSTANLNLVCPDQILIYSNEVFVYGTDGTGAVFLRSHVTRQDMKAATNNGQAHVTWCVGLKGPGVWGFAQQDTNSSGGIDAGDLYVGTAPACPSKDPSSFAPCITRQYGDGTGGSWTEGYLPGGDPPRRT